MKLLAYALLMVLSLSFQSSAIECPKMPEQTNKEWDVEVKAAIGKIGPVKGAELETRTRRATLDLMGKLPQADKVYLEQMMYATYCSALRDDKSLSESDKAARIRAYNLEVRKTLYGPSEKKEPKQKGALPVDERMEARLRLSQMSLAFTNDAFVGSVKKGDIDAVKLFLAAGMDPNTKDKDGNTVLKHAVREGHRPIMDVLLKAKASVNEKNNWGLTALSDAVRPGKKDILLVLLKHGASVEALNGAFVAAASYGDRNTLEILIKRGADIRAIWHGKSIREWALRNAVDVKYSSVPEKELNETVKYLLDLGADVNTQFEGEDGKKTALLVAVSRGRETIVRTLLDRGADPRTRWECNCLYHGLTPLMVAVRDAGATMVTTLLERGADINAKCDPNNSYDYGGSTALTLAVTRNTSEVAEILIKRNADISIRDNRGDTAFLLSAAYGDSVIMKTLIDKDIDINQRDNVGYTALMKASRRCNADKVRILLDKGADVNLKSNDGGTALMSAAVRLQGCEEGPVRNAPGLVQQVIGIRLAHESDVLIRHTSYQKAKN